ncbi:PREDICTED: uncharacterized protein LOC108972791 [Bactrocera latifrons]|uniref:uncharacterized protein LOC108972791 n=1 Tax=Bactrocera latifrons TaxID=174628 RepID=UPI0008DCD3F1|nr:PREDICTED: uncharacterized protein LOC108972791 [Bactrocera latifrons]
MLTSGNILLLYSLPLLMGYPTLNWNSSNALSISYILRKIDLEWKVSTVIVMNAYKSQLSCLCDVDIKIVSTNTTVKLLNAGNSSSSSKRDSSELLLIRCLPERFSAELLEAMLDFLQNRRNVRILFIWNEEYTAAASRKRIRLQKQQQLLFEYCAEMRLLNVIAIYRDYVKDGHFYTFSYFPEFHLERKTMDEDCFPNRIKDLKGISLRTLPDQLEPWTFVWRDLNGKIQISGFFTKILREFAKRINATLSYPLPVKADVFIEAGTWVSLLQNDTIDVVSGIAIAGDSNSFVDISATVLPVDWTIMMPLPSRIPDSEIFVFLLNSVLGLLLLSLLFIFSSVFTFESLILQRRTSTECFLLFCWTLINVVLRGIIGQPSYVRVELSARFLKRFLYIILFLSGIFMSTLISASLQSYLTSSLRYPRIKHFAELYNSGLKVKVSKYEYGLLPKYFPPEHLKILDDMLVIVPSFEEIQRQRTLLDPRYAFTILSPMWFVMSKYQSHLQQPLFYVNEGIYLSKGIPMAIPLQKNSIYTDALNNMIYEIQSVGLLALWTAQEYDDMVAAKKLNTINPVNDVRSERLDLSSFYWLWWLYGVGVGVSILVFFAELCCYDRTVKKKLAKQKSGERKIISRHEYS